MEMPLQTTHPGCFVGCESSPFCVKDPAVYRGSGIVVDHVGINIPAQGHLMATFCLGLRHKYGPAFPTEWSITSSHFISNYKDKEQSNSQYVHFNGFCRRGSCLGQLDQRFPHC